MLDTLAQRHRTRVGGSSPPLLPGRGCESIKARIAARIGSGSVSHSWLTRCRSASTGDACRRLVPPSCSAFAAPQDGHSTQRVLVSSVTPRARAGSISASSRRHPNDSRCKPAANVHIIARSALGETPMVRKARFSWDGGDQPDRPAPHADLRDFEDENDLSEDFDLSGELDLSGDFDGDRPRPRRRRRRATQTPEKTASPENTSHTESPRHLADADWLSSPTHPKDDPSKRSPGEPPD